VPIGQRRKIAYGRERYQIFIPDYDLQDKFNLYLNFSQLKTDEDSILKFATKYGALGIDTHHRFTKIYNEIEKSKEWEGHNPPFRGDRYEEWVTEIGEMAIAIKLYELILANNTVSLKKYLHIPKDENKKPVVMMNSSLSYYCPVMVEYNDYCSFFPIYLDQVSDRRRNPITYAKFILQQMINEHLVKYTGRIIAWGKPPEQNRPAFYNQPLNLVGALWLQFTEKMTVTEKNGKRQFPCPCQSCGTLFAASRSDAQHCHACKQRLKRTRRAHPQTSAE
jgi:hypothetical protein